MEFVAILFTILGVRYSYKLRKLLGNQLKHLQTFIPGNWFQATNTDAENNDDGGGDDGIGIKITQ